MILINSRLLHPMGIMGSYELYLEKMLGSAVLSELK